MFRIEWDDGFEGIDRTPWTDDTAFINGMYKSLIANGNSNVRIVKKTDVTEEFLKNKVE